MPGRGTYKNVASFPPKLSHAPAIRARTPLGSQAMTVVADYITLFNLSLDYFQSQPVTNHIRDIRSLCASHMVEGQYYRIAFPTVGARMCCEIIRNIISASLSCGFLIGFELCFSARVYSYTAHLFCLIRPS